MTVHWLWFLAEVWRLLAPPCWNDSRRYRVGLVRHPATWDDSSYTLKHEPSDRREGIVPDEETTTRDTFREAIRSNTPVFSEGGDPDNPHDPLNHQPHNIPAVVHNHLRAMNSNEAERMRSFTMRVEEIDHFRLVLLAEALGTSKTTLARELLQMAIGEAVQSLPEEMAEELRRKFLEQA